LTFVDRVGAAIWAMRLLRSPVSSPHRKRGTRRSSTAAPRMTRSGLCPSASTQGRMAAVHRRDNPFVVCLWPGPSWHPPGSRSARDLNGAGRRCVALPRAGAGALWRHSRCRLRLTWQWPAWGRSKLRPDSSKHRACRPVQYLPRDPAVTRWRWARRRTRCRATSKVRKGAVQAGVRPRPRWRAHRDRDTRTGPSDGGPGSAPVRSDQGASLTQA
jgi:hypothetical protein